MFEENTQNKKKERNMISSINLSHARNVQLAIINSERIKTRRTVPGHIVMRVFKTNVVLNLIRLNAPILLDDASIKFRTSFFLEICVYRLNCLPVNNLLCKSITRQMRYKRKKIGNERSIST